MRYGIRYWARGRYLSMYRTVQYGVHVRRQGTRDREQWQGDRGQGTGDIREGYELWLAHSLRASGTYWVMGAGCWVKSKLWLSPPAFLSKLFIGRWGGRFGLPTCRLADSPTTERMGKPIVPPLICSLHAVCLMAWWVKYCACINYNHYNTTWILHRAKWQWIDNPNRSILLHNPLYNAPKDSGVIHLYRVPLNSLRPS